MKVTCEINDYSDPKCQKIKIHSIFAATGHVELEVNGKELISAIERCTLNYFER